MSAIWFQPQCVNDWSFLTNGITTTRQLLIGEYFNFHRVLLVVILPPVNLYCHSNFHIVCISRPKTLWGQMTHICVSKLNIIGSDNGMSPGWRQAIIWTSAGILLMGPLGTNNEILIFIQENPFQNVVWIKVAILSQPHCVNDWSLLTNAMMMTRQLLTLRVFQLQGNFHKLLLVVILPIINLNCHFYFCIVCIVSPHHIKWNFN